MAQMWTSELARPRIYWHTLAKRWAIRIPLLLDELKARRLGADLQQMCGGVFHCGAEAWMVPENQLDPAVQLVAKYYRHYVFVDRSEPAPKPEPAPRRAPLWAPPPAKGETYRTFCRIVEWADGLPLSFAVAKHLYRRAAIRLHPDVGGSSEEMAALNATWQAIKDILP